MSETSYAYKKRMIKEKTRRHQDGLQLWGHTYTIRAKLQALGGIFDHPTGCWLMPDEQSMQQLGAEHSKDVSTLEPKAPSGPGWFLPKDVAAALLRSQMGTDFTPA